MSLVNIQKPVVKICGLQSVPAAQCAIDSGANFLGIICVPNRKRTVDAKIAKEISRLVHSSGNNVKLVGVFRNQTKEDVLKLAQEYELDIIQLHGDEAWNEYYDFLKMPIIKRMVFPRDCVDVLRFSNEPDILCLFDSEAGGTGELLNWDEISKWTDGETNNTRFILAGGLTPENVNEAFKIKGVIGVDVSGGIETDGQKDLNKISKFVENAKK